MADSDSSSPRIHPKALCESSAVGNRTRVWAFAHIMEGATAGRDCNIGEHAFVEAGATLGDRVTVKNGVMIWAGVSVADDVFLGPAVVFTNDRWPRSPRLRDVPNVAARYAAAENWLERTRVERGASIGAAAAICPGVTIGRWAMVAAGAVVTRNVLPHQLVAGNPARAVGWVCFCGKRLADPPVSDTPCESCSGPASPTKV